MSDGDVSLIHDEDLLRRMWQQTEDFSRKKEIRAHMYRLREERLRNLYSPEPKIEGKGREFTAAQDHVKSFADQSFQSMKSKEVRDAGSPPKEFTYRGQDLKALSNAGWNVEQENKTTDDGRTHVKSINANIEGSYDVDGGKGQFAAVDHHKEAVTEYHDDNSSMKRNETSSNTAAREHVVRQTDDSTHVTSTTSSSTSSSKKQQMSSTRHESVPYVTDDDYDLRSYDTNRNDDGSSVTKRQIIKTNDYEQNLRNNEYTRTSRNDYEQTLRKNDYEQTVRKNDYETGELVSRKVDYPDDNTRVIVETRCLPDGTRVTSTKREFRAPVQTTRAEQSYQTRSENRSYSTQQRSNTRDSSKVIQHVIDNQDSRSTNIVDSQRNVDNYDFKRQITDYSTNDVDDYSTTQYERKVDKRVIDTSNTDDSYDTVHRVTKINKTVTDDDQSNIHRNVTKINKTAVHHSKNDNDYSNVERHQTTVNRNTTDSSKIDDNYSKLQHQDTNVNQRIVDHSKTDDDFKHTTQRVIRTHKIIESTDNDDYVQTDREINQRRYVPNDDRPERITTPDNRNIHPKDYKDVQPKDRQPGRSQPESYSRSSQPRDTSPVESYPRDSRDKQPKNIQPKNTEVKYVEEKIHNITRDDKVETIERKISTEERKTTYQTDFSHKKISNDWSPSHTAWASTLRGDTPSTNRPSTRASSPGSRTFRSSTSSLRSSVSPDKTYRKPLSRGSSPNKIDRSSPTRSVSDQHYTTHSTHSITETKSHKHMTPDERRPPTGRTPSGSGYSPERKPQDHRQRSSASPEKRPQDLVQRSSISPDRKPSHRTPTDSRPRTHSPIQPVDRRHSPTRPQESPERKFSQHIPSVTGYPSSPSRSSISPEKTPTNRHPKDTTTRPGQSPDRKPGYRKPFDGIPDNQRTTTPTHPTDTTKILDHPSRPTTEKNSRDDTPSRESISPDRKPGYMMPTASRHPSDARKPPAKPADKHSPTKHTPSPSPTRKPQDSTTTQNKKYHEDHYKFIDEETKMYTRTDKFQVDDSKRVLKGPESPTPREKSSSPTRKSPSKETDITRKVPGRRSPSPKQHVTNIEKLDQVDTSFVTTTDVTDSVTTTYRTPKDTKSSSHKTTPRETSPSKFGTYDKKKPHTETIDVITKNKSPSPTRKSPNKDTDVTKKVPEKRTTSPGYHVTTTEKHDRIDTTIKTTDVTDNVTNKSSYPRDTDSPSDKTTPREKSPSKFGTYDKKRPHSETTEDDKYEPSMRAKSPKSTPAHSVSPTRKTPEVLPSPTKKAPERSTSPNKKTPRDSVSPVKSPTKSTKYTHTTDFLTHEKTTEEVNKKMTKEHPRQLITPSSSPTRQPKRPTDTEPSTGQSSPTTSVSGFVYFSSPRTEQTLVTDLDDHESTETHSFDITTTTSKRPENLEVKRSPSPSKIPCRSPSPERRTSPPKDSLPRKSSLKKPGTYTTQGSPVEKPPTTFLISPTEPKEFPSHKTVKKDRPDEVTSKSPLKSKPPLERRETYEDRCRKILGMTEDTNETVTTQTTYLMEPATNLSSPSISPCRSPAPTDTTFTYPTTKKDINSKIDVTDFITHEQENVIKSTGPQNVKSGDKIPKSVRDSSPTKLQDIITVEKSTEETDIKTTSTTKYHDSRQSPQRKPSHQTRKTPEHESPDRDNPGRYQKPKDKEFVPSSSPAKLHPGSSPRSSSSPDRKIEPKEKKSNAKTSYSETTTTVSSKYNSDKDTEEITVTTKTTDRKPSRSFESPTQKAPWETINKPTHPSNEIPQRKSEQAKKPNLETTISMVAEYDSTEDLVESVEKTTKTRVHPSQPTKSPTRKSSTTSDSSPTRTIHPSQKITETSNRKQPPRTSPEKKLGDKPKDSSPTRPGYIKTTTSITSKQETTTEKPSLTEPHSLKPEQSSDRTRTSPDRKPDIKYPEDSSPTHGKAKKVHGYMKVTESVSSKYDTTSSEHDEKTTTLKTERYHPSETMEPTRKASKHDVTEKVSDLKPDQKSSPRDTERQPKDKRSKETSPHRSNTEKTPHYMTPISSHQHSHETETIIEDERVQRKFANYTERHPGDTGSRDTSPHRSNTEKTPHYMTPISSHQHSHETETIIEAERVQRKFANYTERHPGDTGSRDTSPHRSNTEKTPHYMTPISSHQHSNETETIAEDERVQRKFANYTERHPGDTGSRDTSPHRSNTEKTPHYMTPISSHQHSHETETIAEDERVQRKFANYTERHPGDTGSRDTSPHHSNTEKTPHYMTPISSHQHSHETETIAEDERVQRKFANYTERHPGDTGSRDTSPHRSNTEKTPHYMTPISSHQHSNETETINEAERVQRKFANYTERHPGDTGSRNTSPHRSNTEKTPHYMTPISSHQHSHETETINEAERVQRKFANYTERHPGDTGSRDTSPHRSNTEKTPHYMTPISSHHHSHETETINEAERVQRKFANYTERHPGDTGSRDTSPHRSNTEKTPHYMTPISSHRHTHEIETTTEDERVQRTRSPTHQSITKETPHYMTPISSHLHKHDTVNTKDHVDNTSTVIEEKRSTIGDNTPGSDQPRVGSPTSHQHPKDSIPTNQNTERKPLERKPSEPTEKFTPRSSASPSRIRSPDESPRTRPGYLREPEKPRQLRTPSPSKTTIEVTEISTDFLMSEREQEILDRVHKSLRKLSPERKEKSPSRERSPGKTTTSLQDIDINTTTTHDAQIISEEVTRSMKKDTAKIDIPRSGKPKEETPRVQNVPSKPSSRNTSPTKRSSGIASPVKIDSATKPRSISPKKPLSPTEQPPSPTVPKASGIKPKEQIPSHLTRKPTPATLAMTKVEKTTTDLKRITGAIITTKQNSVTKTTTSTTTTKSIPSPTGRPSEPRTPTPKGIRESGIPKKEIDAKVTRTVSDITIKSKKTSPTSPQRMKSKPEIQVSDLSNSKTASKPQKSSLKEPQLRLPGKPKSATALNTPSDEDDVIIDVQQSKSSRENSPDRICPTPVNFVDDTETPRYPDEVKEPDDEYRRRTYHTIHETESIVDDIVEICEDDELFVRKSDIENLTEEDESLLSVTDKVTKFTKGIDTKKPKDTTDLFKDTERRVHSDFVKDNLTSDECLLSVSEKVNKFAKGPRDIKDKSPARRVVDEYDKNTVYTDDYTKLSVHDKAHLFVETAENVKSPKSKPTPQKVERPDLSNVDEDLKSDDCLLSVSDKVHKFVKTAEQFLTENHEVEEKEKKIKEQHDKIMKKIVDDVSDDADDIDETTLVEDVEPNIKKAPNRSDSKPVTKLTTTSHTKVKDHSSPSLSKPTERTPTVKITTLRSSEAVKKAKALFENIASTTPKTKDTIHPKTTTKLTDIGVLKKSPKTDSTTVLHPSVEEVCYNIADTDSEVETAPTQTKDRLVGDTLTRPQPLHLDDKPRASPTRLAVQSPDGRRSKSPMRHTVETTTTIKTTLTKYPSTQRAESPKHRVEGDKPEKVPGYLRPTKTSQSKEEPKVVDEPEVSSRRGSGKFGVELRRTSVERSTMSSERRRSVEHPCIEDIFDLDLLEQMLEKVVGYEQRRRIRAQIRIARKSNTDHVDHTARTRTIKQTTVTQKDRSSERHHNKSPERAPKTTPHKTSSPDRHAKIPHRSIPERSQPKEHEHPVLNGHTKESAKVISDKRNRTHSPEKLAPKSALKTKSPIRPASPDKKTRTLSPSKTASPKPKANRFNEYASAYMKKVGLSEADKLKFAESKKMITEEKHMTETQVEDRKIIEELSTSKHVTERTSSKDIIEVIQTNGSKRSPSPEKRRSPERKSQSRERLHERTSSPHQKEPIHQTKSEPTKNETIIRTVYEVDKKTPQKQTPEAKPSWVTNRNLKKITSETPTFSSKKIEYKPKYRAASPSKVISKPIDVITSSYGPGPLDAEGKPLFGIKALRNGASNYQVKGTVIRQEYHSRNGGEPEGTVSVTAYSTEPQELEQLLQRQGDQPSRIHGLAAITTTKKFGGDTGTTLKEIHGKEERAAIDQFTHSDRRVTDSRVSDTRIEDVTESFSSRREITGDSKRIETRKEEIIGDTLRDRTDNKTDKMQRRVERVEKVEKKDDRVERRERPDDKKTVRQSSVKSLTEKYIKNANESSKAERTTYPKAGLILRTATMKDSVSSDSSAHAGLARTDSEHSLGSVEDTVVTTERCEGGVRTVTTTTRSHGHVTHSRHAAEPERTLTERSFLDSNTKVTGVQDILTRMKNADIVIQEGDTSEDMEARALLNKFLGATVLMAGMQSYVTEKPSGKVVVKQETVRSSNNGGKVSSSQTRSVQEYDIDQCWDERLLRKLLDESKDYDQRRRLRARIRALMAEQEACASAVTEALAAAGEAPEDTNEARGESLLLPLLQGLLGGGGERLLAGLGAAPADVVADVRRSLARLRAALAPPAAHPQARALLALADRLEDALDAADRLDGCRQRRPRRRSRTARHTVGVTRGELDEARRLVDNDQLALPGDRVGSSATSSTSVNTTDEALTPERKQSVVEELSYHEAVPSQQRPNPIAHSISYEVTPPVNRDAVVVEKRAPTQRKPDFYRHSVADVETQRPKPHKTLPVQQIAQPPQPVQQPQSQVQPRQVQLPQPHPLHQPLQPQPLHQPQPAFPSAPMYPSQPPHQPPPYMDRRSSESKSSIAAIANKFDSHARDTSSDRKENVARRAPIEYPVQQKELKREDKHTYMPLPPTYNFAAPPTSQDDSKPLNRFSNNNKRLRMKRANTIDIGRPLAGYRLDSEEDDSPTQPKVPEFRPQTENDRKFVAFMKKNEAAERETAGTVQANWSNRFGNIKHAFESREREDHSRSSSASSARRFWRGADEGAVNPGVARPRKFLSENAVNIIKPPWVSERREPARVTFPRQVQQAPAPAHTPARAPAPLPSRKPVSSLPAAPAHPPAAPPTHPPIPQSPTKPLVVKPFATRPIPVNQFSHAPMSAFKPPTKVASPTTAPANVWSPPSVLNNIMSPTKDIFPVLPVHSSPTTALSPTTPDAPWAAVPEVDKPRRVATIATTKFSQDGAKQEVAPYKPAALHPPPPPTHALPQIQNYPAKTIPNQYDLSAPELVRKIDDSKYPAQDSYVPKVDAQRLQIEFYEKQIREKTRREAMMNGHAERKPPAPPAYTITDYTPTGNISTFVPLQRTPDIEKARAHKVDYLPDVVTNDTDRQRSGASPHAPRAPISPLSPRSTHPMESPHAYHNGDVPYTNGVDDGVTTEHNSVVTRVMRGPVRGSATITTGVRTRNDEGRRGSAADSLRGALDKLASPKNDVIAQIERKKRETAKTQVRAPVHAGRSPLPAPAPPHVRPPTIDLGGAPPSPGALVASRESVSSESVASLGSSPLSRSGSWQHIAVSPKATSPRRVVARAKSMHLLAVPKLYEGGIAREEVTEKKRTVEAYFSREQQQKRSAAAGRPRALRPAAGAQAYSLGRSRTMPSVSELQFLDESNTDDAFEDLVSALEEEEVTVTSSVRRNSSEKTVSSSTTTTKTSKVIESMTRPAPKPVSPFAKFRQLEKQNSTNSPNSASPKSPGSPAPYFKFTEPALQASAATIKERLLQWCRDKTRDYENVKLENFSTSWADGLAFCALLHHFLPDAFDYSRLSADKRRENFTLAFKLADEKAGIYPLLDVDDMVAMRKPDWKCVFTYVQSIHRRFKDE